MDGKLRDFLLKLKLSLLCSDLNQLLLVSATVDMTKKIILLLCSNS